MHARNDMRNLSSNDGHMCVLVGSSIAVVGLPDHFRYLTLRRTPGYENSVFKCLSGENYPKIETVLSILLWPCCAFSS